MSISLENLQAGNVVVLRNGTEHVIESVIFTCPVQLLIAEDQEKYLTVYLKFVEEPFDISHLYGLDGNFSITEDPRDVVEIRGLLPKVYVAHIKYGYDENHVLGLYQNHKPTAEQLLDAINQEIQWQTPITMDEYLISRVSKLRVIIRGEVYTLNNMQIALNSLIEHAPNASMEFDEYIVEIQEHVLEQGLLKG